MKVITHTITHQAKSAGGQIESIMYPAKFAGGRSRLDLLLPSFLPSREEKKKRERRKQSIDSGAEWHTPHMDRVRIKTKKQEQIFCPLRGHSVGRMLLRLTTCQQKTLYLINSQEERIETKIQDQKNRPLGSRGRIAYALHGSRKDRNENARENFLPLSGSFGWAYAIRPYNLPAGDVVSNKFSGRKDRNEDAGKKKAIDR